MVHVENGSDTAGISAGWNGYVYVVKFTGLVPGDTIDKVAIEVSNAVGNVRYKIYSDDGEHGEPHTLLAESNSIAAAGGKVYNSLISNAVIPASGNVWVGFECDSVLLSIFYALVGNEYSVLHTYGTGPSPFGQGGQTLLTQFWAGINVNAVSQTKTFKLGSAVTSLAKTKTFTVGGKLVRIKTFLLRTITAGPGTGNKKFFTLGSVLVNRKTKTFTLRVVDVSRRTASFLLGAVIKDTDDEDFSLGVKIIKLAQTKTFTLRTIVVLTSTKSFLLGCKIKLIGTTPYQLGAAIKKTFTKSFTMNLKTQRRKQFTLGAITIQRSGTFNIVYTRKGVRDSVYTRKGLLDTVYTKKGVKDNVNVK